MSNDELIEQLIGQLNSLDYIRARDIPNIDLYMDQVTTFMNDHLNECKRYEDDKILTKTMINNYSKNDLLPPPVKKKYSREHMFVLIFIYYFKNFLSISDIHTLLQPLADSFFKGTDINFESIYQELYGREREFKSDFTENLRATYEQAKETFIDAPEDSREYLQLFSMVCLLGFDVYLKKQMIERITDHISEMNAASSDKSDKKEKK